MIINLLISSSVPILNKIEKGVFTTTLLGSLCLISQIHNMSTMSHTYENIIIVWLGNSFYWIATKYFQLKNNPNGDTESNLSCVDKLFRKSVQMISKNEKFINDCTVQIANMLNLCNLNFIDINFLIIFKLNLNSIFLSEWSKQYEKRFFNNQFFD